MSKSFRFIDLFAGIGGTRLGFENAGGNCVFTSEWDKHAQFTYAENFSNKSSHQFISDIRSIHESDVPDHEVLVAGFPCQPFSAAGVSKKNSLGKPHGFLDATQGTLFFDVARIIGLKRPKVFMLENVKNLLAHDGGRTFRVIQNVLTNELGYTVSFKVIDSRYWVPQSRKRIYIIGIESAQKFDFEKLSVPNDKPVLGSILHPQNGSETVEHRFTYGKSAKVLPKYTLGDATWEYLQKHAELHKQKGNGFGYGLFDKKGVARTLSSRYYKDGSEILIKRGNGKLNPRRLTPRECARLMGFSDDYRIIVSDTQAYRQFGNSVVVPVVSEIARKIVPFLA
jgi:DNA (cytosine-5)-methyltransferase 1